MSKTLAERLKEHNLTGIRHDSLNNESDKKPDQLLTTCYQEVASLAIHTIATLARAVDGGGSWRDLGEAAEAAEMFLKANAEYTVARKARYDAKRSSPAKQKIADLAERVRQMSDGDHHG